MAISTGVKILGAAAVLTVGYQIFKPRRERRRVAPTQPAPLIPLPTPLPPPGEPTKPAPGAEAPAPGLPPRDWQERFDQGIEAALEAAQKDPDVRTLEEAQTFAVRSLFRGPSWPPKGDAPEWQDVVWDTSRDVLLSMARSRLGWQTTPEAAATFWLAADKEIDRCIGLQRLNDVQAIKKCAAQRMFPGVSWPPSGDSSAPWQYEVWTQLDHRVELTLQAREVS